MKQGLKVLILCAITFFCIFDVILDPAVFSQVAAAETATTEQESPNTKIFYRNYNAKYTDFPAGSERIYISANEFTGSYILPEYEGESNVALLTDESGSVDCSFSVQNEGLYRIAILYYPIADGGALEPNLAFLLDGKKPFEEASSVYLSKIYTDESAVLRDVFNNDIRPKQIEKTRWRQTDFIDNSGFNPDPFELFLTVGEHELNLEITQQSVAIKQIIIYGAKKLPTYTDVEAEYEKCDYDRPKGEPLVWQAEQTFEKSNPSISPESGNYMPNSLLEPSFPNRLRLNVISSSKPPDWISWKVKVEQSGLYRIGMRVLQMGNRGVKSSRRLYIDGKVPFAEAERIEVPYSDKWINYIFGEDDPYWFYFEAGREYTLTLECTAGRIAPVLGEIQDTASSLNALCRSITKVTGMIPDIFRDYDLNTEIPDLFEQLEQARDRLQKALDSLDADLINTGSSFAQVEDMVRQLNRMLGKPRSILNMLSNFRVNVSSLFTWAADMCKQWITIDSLYLLPEDAVPSRAQSGFFEQLTFELRSVLDSFFTDYNVLSRSQDQPITVWITSGRDNANILSRQIDSVLLSLVNDSSALLKATLGGKGPDVAIQVDKTLPVNLAARDSLVELSQFERFDDVISRFYPSAIVPYKYGNGVYALPNTQSFNVMFCRTDILTELGLEIPKTWDDFYRALPVIQRNNMQVGMGADAGAQQAIFDALLLQHGGTLYNEDLTAIAWDTQQALDAFKMCTGMFAEYGCPQSYDMFSYFRSGSIPIAIADYTQYNLITYGAPELKGLWDMTPIPGRILPDGSVNRMETAFGTAAIIMKSAKNQKAAFEFLDWWTSTEAQAEYSLTLEAVMGSSARYNSANIETMSRLAWTKSEFASLSEMWKDVRDFPVLPSSYYISRNFANAFRAVVIKDDTPREVLNKYAAIIDKEIMRKNKELARNQVEEIS